MGAGTIVVEIQVLGLVSYRNVAALVGATGVASEIKVTPSTRFCPATRRREPRGGDLDLIVLDHEALEDVAAIGFAESKT